MTDKERADALAWLDEYGTVYAPKVADTLKAMLAEPRLPKEPVRACFPLTERYTRCEWDTVVDAIEDYNRRLHAHLTAPKVPTFKVVWRRPGAANGSGKLARTLFEAMSIATEMVDDGNVVTIEPEA